MAPSDPAGRIVPRCSGPRSRGLLLRVGRTLMSMAVILIVEDQPATLSIVALTGDTRPDTLLRAEAAGFVACLRKRKPAHMDRLETVLPSRARPTARVERSAE